MKVVSFAMFGNESMYIDGMAANAKLIPQFYPGWEMVVYTDRTMDDKVCRYIASQGAHIIPIDGHPEWYARYLALDLPWVEVAIFRDSDSRPSKIEVKLVDEWLASGKKAHSIHAHPDHGAIFMGGLCGFIGGSVSNIREQSLSWSATQGNKRGLCQDFLSSVLCPQLRGSILLHGTPESPQHLRHVPGAEFREFSLDGESVAGGFPGAVVQATEEERRLAG